MTVEKQVSFTTSNTYSTLNNYSSKTKTAWLVFHGMGYLSKYFLKYFEALDPEENFVIAPQAPSKYYMGKKFKHVGASWLTKENTEEDTKSVLNYVDAVFEAEKTKELPRFIVLGYSQGVSIAMRWLTSRKIQCDHLVIHSGGIPIELNASDFDFQDKNTLVTYIYGDKDQYIDEAKKTAEIIKGKKLFGDRLQTLVFTGIHEVNLDFIQSIS